MNDKNLIQKIQSDLSKSNAKIINNNDNMSTIKKKFSSKYTEDISDSEDDLTSYKNRNIKIINDLPNNNLIPNKIIKKTVNTTSKSLPIEKKNISNELNLKLSKNNSNKDLVYELEDRNTDADVNADVNADIDADVDVDADTDLEPEYEYTDEFKKKVKEYVKNDDRIRELQAELKLLNSGKKNAENEILKHLERLGESNVNITGGKLRINQYESKEGLKEDLIKEALSEKIKDPIIIDFIFEKINEKRIANGKVQKSLKRTFERGDNKKATKK